MTYILTCSHFVRRGENEWRFCAGSSYTAYNDYLDPAYPERYFPRSVLGLDIVDFKLKSYYFVW